MNLIENAVEVFARGEPGRDGRHALRGHASRFFVRDGEGSGYFPADERASRLRKGLPPGPGA